MAAYEAMKISFKEIEADYLHWQSEGRALHLAEGK